MVWAASQPVVAGISNAVFLFSLAFVLLFRDKIVQVLRIGALALAFVVAKVFEMNWRFQWSQFIAKAESKLRTAGSTTDLTPQKPRHDKSPAVGLSVPQKGMPHAVTSLPGWAKSEVYGMAEGLGEQAGDAKIN